MIPETIDTVVPYEIQSTLGANENWEQIQIYALADGHDLAEYTHTAKTLINHVVDNYHITVKRKSFLTVVESPTLKRVPMWNRKESLGLFNNNAVSLYDIVHDGQWINHAVNTIPKNIKPVLVITLFTTLKDKPLADLVGYFRDRYTVAEIFIIIPYTPI